MLVLLAGTGLYLTGAGLKLTPAALRTVLRLQMLWQRSRMKY